MRLLFIILVLFSSLITIAQNIYEGQASDWKIGDNWTVNIERFYRGDHLMSRKPGILGSKRGEYLLDISVIDSSTSNDSIYYILLFNPAKNAGSSNIPFPNSKHLSVKDFSYYISINQKNFNVNQINSKCKIPKTNLDPPSLYTLDSLDLTVVFPNSLGQIYGGFPIHFIPSFNGVESAYFSRFGEHVEDVLDAYLIYEKQVLEDEIIVSLKFSSYMREHLIVQKWDKGASWWKEYLVYFNGVLETRATVIEP